MILDLKMTIGDGSLQGKATAKSLTYNINIQEGQDSTLIVPSYLKSDTGRALISFDTKTQKNKVLVRGTIIQDETDMILLYTNLDTLAELTNDPPTVMRIEKDSTSTH
jgi:hypothetical protein